jgi:hypothetical protein
MAQIIGLIRKHYAACEEAVAELPWTDDNEMNENIRKYIRGCRRLATGTAHWSYLVTRYFDQSQLSAEWELNVQLDN